ncbi:MAG: hypothetical protein D6687_11320 [Acidobacteria bacterium]|nr:MAG: hypothetical protein D6687_11320 [Acidobacteriota bacterium]
MIFVFIKKLALPYQLFNKKCSKRAYISILVKGSKSMVTLYLNLNQPRFFSGEKINKFVTVV